ncbi:MAG TPA: hypothetical protein VJS64_14860 [Pyrinomonadaceae bacterium]|nr:hypothetical protein [Pyrinomonadaceae bacterium]
MTEHLTQQECDAVRERSISASARVKVDAHIAVCESCLKRVARPQYAFTALSEALQTPTNELAFHLSRQELRDLLKGSVDEADRIIGQSHLEDCRDCRRAMSELTPEASPSEMGIISTGAKLPRRSVFSSPWPQLGQQPPARLLAALAAIVVLLVVGLLIWRQQTTPSNERADTGAVPGPASDQGNGEKRGNEVRVEQTEIPVDTATVALQDNGNRIAIDAEGKLIGLEELPANTRQSIAAALAGKTLSKPKDLETVTAPPIALLDGTTQSASFKLNAPLGLVVADDRPTLSWQALPGSTSYIASVFSETFDQVATSPPQRETKWQVDRPLPRGKMFFWQVKAVRDGVEITSPVAPARRAQFKVLESEKLRELNLLRQQRPISHLALGITYARFGLVNDAERELQQLLKENSNSPEVKRLLRTVQEWKK